MDLVGRARGWPKYLDERIRFERGASVAHPSLRVVRDSYRSLKSFRYEVDLVVPQTGITRHVTVSFRDLSRIPKVHSDGPTDSPHRYDDDKSLCMWHPGDPDDRRWVFSDGLLDLLDITVAHLFKEQWWRETGEWIGDEVTHESLLSGATP